MEYTYRRKTPSLPVRQKGPWKKKLSFFIPLIYHSFCSTVNLLNISLHMEVMFMFWISPNGVLFDFPALLCPADVFFVQVFVSYHVLLFFSPFLQANSGQNTNGCQVIFLFFVQLSLFMSRVECQLPGSFAKENCLSQPIGGILKRKWKSNLRSNMVYLVNVLC